MQYQSNGYKYDSDRTPVIGSVYETGKKEDGTYGYRALHLTRTGKFFIHCMGNCPEYYAVTRRNPFEKIIPLSYAEAEEWASTHFTAEEYDRYFTDAVGGDPDKPIRMRIVISERKYRLAKKMAAEKGMFLMDYIESLFPDAED